MSLPTAHWKVYSITPKYNTVFLVAINLSVCSEIKQTTLKQYISKLIEQHLIIINGNNYIHCDEEFATMMDALKYMW